MSSVRTCFSTLKPALWHCKYAKIQAPTLVIGARHDAQRPPAALSRVANAIHGSKYVLADIGHFMNVETPQLFVETVLPFFKGSPNSRPWLRCSAPPRGPKVKCSC